jgi:hypothetical protein
MIKGDMLVQSIGTRLVGRDDGDYLELIARQTLGRPRTLRR